MPAPEPSIWSVCSSIETIAGEMRWTMSATEPGGRLAGVPVFASLRSPLCRALCARVAKAVYDHFAAAKPRTNSD